MSSVYKDMNSEPFLTPHAAILKISRHSTVGASKRYLVLAFP
jgi:hypothetical protein